MSELPVLLFKTPTEFAKWLRANAAAPGVWVQIAKKDSNAETISFDDALETAMCYGWVDSMVRRLDDKHYLTKFTLRKPTSHWTPSNQEKAEELIATGRMKPAGLERIELAQQNGKWR